MLDIWKDRRASAQEGLARVVYYSRDRGLGGVTWPLFVIREFGPECCSGSQGKNANIMFCYWTSSHTFPWIWIIYHDVEIRFKSLRAFYAGYALRVVLSMSVCVYVRELGGIYL